MKKTRFATIIGVVTTVSLALAACSGSATESTSTTPSETSATQAAAQKELKLAVGGVGESEFDPLKGWGSHQEHQVLHSSLLDWGFEGDEMKIVGDLAKDWTQEGTTWTFNLRDDYKFSDGVPVTAKDVVFTYELLKDDGTQVDLSNIKSITAVDDYTVEVQLIEPDSLFGPQATTIPIVPEHAYDENYSQNPIASGPYKVVEFKDGEQLIMEPNEYYPEKLTYDRLTFFLADEDTALAAVSAGDIDVAKISYHNADKKFDGMKLVDLDSVEAMGLTLPTEPAGGTAVTMGVEGPAGNDVTSDPAVRKALTLALDREELADIVVGGYGQPGYSVADGLPWGAEVSFQDGDVEAAKQLLAEAGWKDTNGDGTVDKNGTEAVIDLLYTTSAAVRGDLAEAVKAQAEEIGIRFEPRGVTWDDIYAEGKSQSVVFAIGSLSPKELWDTYSSESIGVSYNNMSNYSNPVVDEHLNAARTAVNLEESLDEWKAAQTAGASSNPDADVSMLWLLRMDHLYLVRDGIDIGKQITHGHGHGLQILGNITEWR